jgi:alpha-L-fucosidase
VADFYNKADKRHGKTDVLACIKFAPNNPALGITYEVNFPSKIMTEKPWIGENPVGDWYYAPGYTYQASSMVYSLLEYASRDGNYACAVPITPDGDLEPECVKMLSDMGQWMKTNGEGIYGSKAWKTWGEGELISDPKKPEKAPVLRVFPGGGLSKFHAAFRYETSDFRFTEGNNGALYVWALRIPEQKTTFKIKSLGTQSEYCQSKIKSVRLLGYTQKLKWKQKPDGLYVEFPAGSNLKYSAGLKVELEK